MAKSARYATWLLILLSLLFIGTAFAVRGLAGVALALIGTGLALGAMRRTRPNARGGGV